MIGSKTYKLEIRSDNSKQEFLLAIANCLAERKMFAGTMNLTCKEESMSNDLTLYCIVF
jgi:hypothetical protein